ncbi:MAG: hypothetical protein EXR79_17005 [Myxococcales bacterium]|nr:hypothetical protein [Myxococcales bacterium]
MVRIGNIVVVACVSLAANACGNEPAVAGSSDSAAEAVASDAATGAPEAAATPDTQVADTPPADATMPADGDPLDAEPVELPPPKPQCQSADDCPAAAPCQLASCGANGKCAYVAMADGATCSDGNACSTGDLCAAGQCAAKGELQCDDQNPCTADKCNPLAGCINLPVAASTVCDDGDNCTSGDACEAGQCASGVNICQCKTNSDCGKFEDGNLCNGTLYCDKAAGPPFTCKQNPATVVACPNSQDNACQTNTCIPATGACELVLTPENTPCSDGDKCTTGDFCDKGLCKGGLNTCTCKANADCKAFEDGNACNGTLFCNKALSACEINPLTVVTCFTSSDTYCLQNTCNPKDGNCYDLPVHEGKPCDDGNLCTPNESCQSGQCQSGVNVCECSKDADCAAKDDGNPCNGVQFCELKTNKCTTNPATVVVCNIDDDPACLRDVCDTKSGKCAPVALPKNGTACDDGNPCTVGDTCAGGSCKGPVQVCECQQDSDCAAKEDGDVCNGTLYCDKQAGKCTVNPATVVVCPAAFDETCLANVCNKKTGICGMLPVHQGNKCDSDSVCSAGGWCNFGVCDIATESVCACEKDSDCGKFEDGDLCNGTLYCDKAGAVPACKVNPATLKTCPVAKDSACLKNQCQPASGLCAMAASNGACDDGNACTVGDGCKAGACTAGVAKVCEDGDKCTADLCLSAYGCLSLPLAATVCDDKNPCTDDGCTAKSGCTATANAVPCNDGNACTSADACSGGACLGTAGNCNDGNPCTDDACALGVCVFGNNTTACSDGNACTTGDACSGGKCAAGGKLSCDDKNACTDDSCDPAKGCTGVPNTTPCDDGNACTLNDVCKNGTCGGGSGGCEDNNPCTDDACVAGKCQNAYNAAECSDGNACTTSEKCSGGKCVSTGKLFCDDGKLCTDDGCDPKLGCTTAAKTGACDDGDVCTSQDGCAGGVCTGTKKVCDDGNACTDDSCDSKLGCVAKANLAACSDGSQCTTGDACSNGACKAGVAANCDDNNKCTQDGCNAGNGICVHQDTGAATCDDKNACTDDTCHPVLGCGNVNNAKPCDDGNPCTAADACKSGSCAGGPAVVCDDKQLCTDDSCDPKKGCMFANNTKVCDDGIACTQGDACANGNCVGNILCDDKNPCTQDQCDFATGKCTTLPLPATPCDDGNVCTLGEACKAGVCAASSLKDCNDGNVCTDEACDKNTGCYGIANKLGCVSGDCTVDDQCANKVCVASTKKRLWETVWYPGAPMVPQAVAEGAGYVYAAATSYGAPPSHDASGDAAHYSGTGYLFRFTADGTLDKTATFTASYGNINDPRAVLTDAQGSVFVAGNAAQVTGGRLAKFDKDLNALVSSTVTCYSAVTCSSTVYAAAWVTINNKPMIAVAGHFCGADQSSLTAFAATCDPATAQCGSCWVYDQTAKGYTSTARAISQRSDGNLVIGGWTNELAGSAGGNDAMVAVFTNAYQNKPLVKVKWGTNNHDSVRALAAAPNNNIYAAGYTYALTVKGVRDAFVNRLSPKLDTTYWSTPEATSNEDSYEALVSRADGLVIATGYHGDGGGSIGRYIASHSSEGAVRVTVPTSGTSVDGYRAMAQASNGDLIFWGYSQNTVQPSQYDLRLLRASAFLHQTCTAAGSCSKETWASCDDGKPCTYDWCQITGCTQVSFKLYCSDGDACTEPDICNKQLQCAGTPVICDDKNPCTADSCDKQKGCLNDNLVDGVTCAAGKACKSGVCQ